MKISTAKYLLIAALLTLSVGAHAKSKNVFKAKCVDSTKDVKLSIKMTHIYSRFESIGEVTLLDFKSSKEKLKISEKLSTDYYDPTDNLKIQFTGSEAAKVTYVNNEKEVKTLDMKCDLKWGPGRRAVWYSLETTFPPEVIGSRNL